MRLLVILFILSGCAKIKVPDTEFCADMGILGASCFYSDSNRERDVEKADWDNERFGMLCTTGESYGEWKAAILKLCSETNLCKRVDAEKVATKLDQIQERSRLARFRGRLR